MSITTPGIFPGTCSASASRSSASSSRSWRSTSAGSSLRRCWGKWFIGLIDKALSRVPGFRQLYAAWKQVALTPGGGEGMFAQVVLLADATGATRVLGFTSGQPVGADGRTICVFVPNAPNPLQGRLFFVDRARCEVLNMSVEDAFKLILSTGNYVPETGLSPTGADTTG